MIKLFSGTSNPKLTKKIAKELGIKISTSEVVRFINSEVRVQIEEDVKHQVCVVVQSTAKPTNSSLMELFFFCDALRRQEARKVFGVIPYFGYARQDIQHRIGECVSATVVIRFLESIGFSKIYTFDIHDEATGGVFSIPFKNISSLSLLSDEMKKYLHESRPKTEEYAIVTPDQGGIERARAFGGFFFKEETFAIGVIEKKRNQNVPHISEALELYGNVKGKTVILVDDIITSGKTLINAAYLCMKHGAKKIIAAVVHHEFVPNTIELVKRSPIEKLFSTDTVSLAYEERFEKLEEVCVAKLVAKELRNL